MMKRHLLYLIVILLCVVSGFAQSRRKEQVSGSRAGVVSNIRQVDFKNFIYQLRGERVRFRNGKQVGGDGIYSLAEVHYGDLTGDGKDEAILILNTYTGGNSVGQEGYIYTMNDGRAVMLAEFEGGGNGWQPIYGVRVENGLLRVDHGEMIEGDTPCCPEHYRSWKYRWDGNRLTEISRSPIMRKAGK